MSEKLKLSEAIRTGAKLRPQGFGRLFTSRLCEGGAVCSCALGAAYEAVGGSMEMYEDRPDDSYDWLVEKFPELRLVPGDERDDLDFRNIMARIYEQNDSKKNTREQIADWVESLGY